MKTVKNIKRFFSSTLLLITTIGICDAANHNHGHEETGLPTFCHSQNADSTPDCGKTPTAGFDQQNVLWVVYVEGEYIKLTSSKDMGSSFSDAININPVPEKIYADGENRPKIAFANENEIYISWVKKTEGQYTGDIRFSRSLDNGKSFSAPIIINDDNLLTSHRFDILAVGPDGRIHLTWLDKRDLLAAKKAGKPYVGAALYHAVSSDKGLTFSANKKIADNSCECCRISIEFDQQGNAIALWRHVFPDMIRDHAVVNLDATDTKPVINRVTFDNWQIEACPHHGPDMAIDSQDRLHLFWFTGLAERGGLFYGRYDQTAQQLEHQINIDASPSASRPQVVVMDDQIILVWKVLEDEQTTLKLKTSVDQGETWSATTTLMTTESGSDHPLLFAHNDKVFVSWWTEKEGFQLITLNSNEPGSLRPFNKESISEIENNYKGKDFLLVLWSLDCPPCFKEMELLSALNKQGELPELILVSTDGSEFIPEIISVLKQYGLDRVENRYFNDTPELLRMKIDSNWFGELPRSYFYNNNGDRISHSGVLNQAIIAEWFN